ncbi:MAG: retroviral-like aspartic protease family protein [Candidatus Tectomicrobia bacterium]|uniref:Retroviral-like aspartic protease family protein n=1 Tax=Tectimicrobiota bacterium TaxID=2528274 RepID=A0A933GJ66_UNCTE|nr:retroviral-like aspartic protease family protein [Candidatus Tectomicrobia bacterium]
MGKVETKVLLTNHDDLVAAKLGVIKPEEVRKVEAVGLVDTGATRLILPQDIVDKLGLEVSRRVTVVYGDNRKGEKKIAGVVTIQIDNRTENTDCVVEEAGAKILIGQIVLEGMDLYVDCKSGKLIPRPGYEDMPLMEIM